MQHLAHDSRFARPGLPIVEWSLNQLKNRDMGARIGRAPGLEVDPPVGLRID